jgi:hypothetical protein
MFWACFREALAGKPAENHVAPSNVTNILAEGHGCDITADDPSIHVSGITRDCGGIIVARIGEIEPGVEKPEVQAAAPAEHTDHAMN